MINDNFDFADEQIGEFLFEQVIEMEQNFTEDTARWPKELYIHSQLYQHIVSMDRYQYTEDVNVAGLDTQVKDWLPVSNIILAKECEDYFMDSVSWCYNVLDNKTIWKTWE
jgi:hypothetical protein